MTIRPFEARDYARQAAIGTAIEPDQSRGPAWYIRRDQSWDPSMRRQRLVAERADLVVGWGEVGHMWWAYHPRKFVMRLSVDPACQRQGIGSKLYAGLMDALADWDAEVVRSEARESRPASQAFLVHRGFAEVRRRWESRLVLTDARTEQYAGVDARLDQQGIRITTFADARARRGEDFVRDLYDLEQRANRGEPGFDPDAVTPFAQFVANELSSADVLDDGSFLALAEQRLVGVSRLRADPAVPGRLHVGFTGVEPCYRGRGIAIGLKLRTVDYGRTRGFDEIVTTNDAANAAMLHINASLGFQLESQWLSFEKRFGVS